MPILLRARISRPYISNKTPHAVAVASSHVNQPPLEFDGSRATLIATLDLLEQPPPLHSGEGLSVIVHFLPTLPLSDMVEQRGNRNEPSRKIGQPAHQLDKSRIQPAVSIEPERQMRVRDTSPAFFQQPVLVALI